jgi:transposase-like protein
MPRRKFTREFKVSAVKLVNEQGYAPMIPSFPIAADNARHCLRSCASRRFPFSVSR